MSPTSIKRTPITASEGEQSALSQIESLLDRSTQSAAVILDRDGEAIELPDSLLQVLRDAVHSLANDEAISVIPVGRELTSQQAADLLNVSRPYLIQLLDAGEIPYRKVGTHRRIELGHVMEYKQRRDQKRRDGLREITQISQEMGLYDNPEANP